MLIITVFLTLFSIFGKTLKIFSWTAPQIAFKVSLFFTSAALYFSPSLHPSLPSDWTAPSLDHNLQGSCGRCPFGSEACRWSWSVMLDLNFVKKKIHIDSFLVSFLKNINLGHVGPGSKLEIIDPIAHFLSEGFGVGRHWGWVIDESSNVEEPLMVCSKGLLIIFLFELLVSFHFVFLCCFYFVLWGLWITFHLFNQISNKDIKNIQKKNSSMMRIYGKIRNQR